MHKVKLIHWKSEEVEQRKSILHSAGYQVDSNLESGTRILKSLAEDPPAAIIIDLSRLPSQAGILRSWFVSGEEPGTSP